MTQYWGETDYPTRRQMKEAGDNLTCPDCKTKGMPLRWSKKGQPFFSCPKYSEGACKGTRNWMGEAGWPGYDWEDLLAKENKIDPEVAANPPKVQPPRESDVEFWKKRFLEERAFVIQQLNDIKAAYTSVLGRVEQLEQGMRLLTNSGTIHQQLAEREEAEDDIPF